MSDDVDAVMERELVREAFDVKERERASKQRLADKTDECVECGDRISKKRQKATGGTQHCTPCAEIEDLKNKGYRHAHL